MSQSQELPSQPNYGQHPPVFTAPPPADPGPTPRSVNLAVILLFVQAALGLASLVLVPDTVDKMMALEPPPPGEDAETTKMVEQTALGFGITFAIIVAGLTVFLSLLARQGRNWARIVLIVFIIIALSVTPFNLAGVASGVGGPLNLAFDLPALAINVLVLVLLLRRPARSWFAAKSAQARYRKAAKLVSPHG